MGKFKEGAISEVWDRAYKSDNPAVGEETEKGDKGYDGML
jgi:hypothetical protein